MWWERRVGEVVPGLLSHPPTHTHHPISVWPAVCYMFIIPTHPYSVPSSVLCLNILLKGCLCTLVICPGVT